MHGGGGGGFGGHGGGGFGHGGGGFGHGGGGSGHSGHSAHSGQVGADGHHSSSLVHHHDGGHSHDAQQSHSAGLNAGAGGGLLSQIAHLLGLSGHNIMHHQHHAGGEPDQSLSWNMAWQAIANPWFKFQPIRFKFTPAFGMLCLFIGLLLWLGVIYNVRRREPAEHFAQLSNQLYTPQLSTTKHNGQAIAPISPAGSAKYRSSSGLSCAAPQSAPSAFGSPEQAPELPSRPAADSQPASQGQAQPLLLPQSRYGPQPLCLDRTGHDLCAAPAPGSVAIRDYGYGAGMPYPQQRVKTFAQR